MPDLRSLPPYLIRGVSRRRPDEPRIRYGAGVVNHLRDWLPFSPGTLDSGFRLPSPKRLREAGRNDSFWETVNLDTH